MFRMAALPMPERRASFGWSIRLSGSFTCGRQNAPE
jgi:hypothetical protein